MERCVVAPIPSRSPAAADKGIFGRLADANARIRLADARMLRCSRPSYMHTGEIQDGNLYWDIASRCLHSRLQRSVPDRKAQSSTAFSRCKSSSLDNQYDRVGRLVATRGCKESSCVTLEVISSVKLLLS